MPKKAKKKNKGYNYPLRLRQLDGMPCDIKAHTPEELSRKIDLHRKKREANTKRSTPISKDILVKDWAERWRDSYKTGVGSGWSKNIANICNRISEHIGNMQVVDVRQIHIQDMFNSMAKYSESYLKQIYEVTDQMFAAAVSNGLIDENPVEGTTLPKGKPPKKRRSITEVERKFILLLIEKLLKISKKRRIGLFYKIMLFAGLRPGEVAALQRRHINLKTREIIIDSALKDDNTIGEPKTEAAYRSVPILDELYDDLKAAISGLGPYDFVCPQASGRHHTQSSLRQMWDTFKRHLNIEMGCETFKGMVIPPYRVAYDLIPYFLRHTYCTDLEIAGVRIEIACRLMGHSSIEVTRKIYTHKSVETFEEAAEAMNRLNKKRKSKDSEMASRSNFA